MSGNNYTRVVGIDISKSELVVGSSFDFKCGAYKNDAKGIVRLTDGLERAHPDLVVFEASGGYERALATSLHARGIKLHLANPYRVKELANGMGYDAKTDPIDARKKLVDYGLKRCPDPTPQPDQHVEELDELRLRSRQLIDIRTAEKNRLDTAPDRMRDDIKEHIAWLDKKIRNLEGQIADKIKSTAKLQQIAEIVSSVPGIGPATTATLIAGLPELGTLDDKQIASLVGVAPHANDSGKFKGKRFIRGGRTDVRTALYIAVLTTIRLTDRFKTYYQHLLAKGKAKKLAIIACVRKLLMVLSAMVRRTKNGAQISAGLDFSIQLLRLGFDIAW